MKSKIRATMFLTTILTVLAISAFWTLPALADDEVPPPVPTSEPVQPPEEVPPPVAESSSVEQPATDAPPVEIPVAEEVPLVVEEPAPLEETTAEVLASVPEGTEVVVVNAEGEPIPLVTQEAADAIAFVDPVWCPTGVTPQNGLGGCTTSYASLKELVDNLMAGTAGVVPGANGVIWIASGADASTGAILLDGTDASLGTMETFSLTLKGGWNGTFGSMTTNPLTPSTFTNSISIINWLGDITLTDITISGVTSGTALVVETSQKVNLDRVKVNTNPGAAGARLGNGTLLGVKTGNVTITSSQFNNNTGGEGLEVYSKGLITISNITANNNSLHAAYLDNTSASTAQPVTLTGTNTFNNNLYGLDIESKGVITINNVTANFNPGGYGAYLRNHTASTPQNVILTGTNIFNNDFGGLYIESKGGITVNNVTANANTNNAGAWLMNTAGAGDVLVTSSQFNDNVISSGLSVFSNGVITLTNVIASNNGNDGAYLVNSGASTAKAVSVTNGTFNGNGQFLDGANAQMGLEVYSKGVITLKDIDAIGNGNADADVDDGGISLDNTAGTAAVSLLGTNIVSENEWGLGIWSNGAITVNNLVAVSNCCGSGAYIDNSTAATAQPVTFTGFVQANYNARGLHIYSKGVVTLNNVTAMNNQGTGAEAGGVYIKNDFGFASNVTLLGTNNFIDNSQRGLYVSSLGIITLNNVSANGNGHGVATSDGWGAYLDNSGGVAKAVLINGVNSFGWNYWGGLAVFSKGAITVNNVSANGNNNDTGVLLTNDLGTAQNVTLAGSTSVNNNAVSGLVVNSYGVIVLGNVTANDNGDTGVYLGNQTGTLPKSVTLNGYGDFHNNGGSGLKIESLGAVIVNNIQASNNTLYGLYVDNNFALAVGGITLKGDNGFQNNGNSGLEAYSKGNILANNTDASNNGTTMAAGDGYGAYLQNNYPGSLATVTLTGYGNFNNNYETGLVIFSKGAINISGVDASGNDNNGAVLKNDFAGAVGGITISGWGGNFGDNIGFGLNATSFGAIKASGLWAWANTLYGATLDNSAGTGTVTITGDTGYGNNALDGLIILSKGAIALGTIYTDTNDGIGVILDNTFSGTAAPQNVTLNGAYHDFNSNSDDGLWVNTYGMITITNLYANGNGGFGAFLDNCLQTVPGTCATITAKPVTLNGDNTFVWNGSNGLDITSKGVITVNNVTASDNDGFGAFLDNQMTGAVGTVSVKNTPTFGPEFARNGFDGLKIHSNGAITVMDLDAYENGQAGNPLWGYGVYLDNASGGGTGAVSLGTSRANWHNALSNNFLSGLEIYSNGAVSLSNLRANDNGHYNSGTDTYFGYGVFVDNSGGTLQNVTLNGKNTFQSNWLSGLEVYSHGIITLNNVTARWNGRFDDPLGGGADSDGPDTVYGNGVFLDNCDQALGVCTVTPPKAVLVNGSNTFEGNWGSGLDIYSNGAVTVNNINANNNGWGMYIVNNSNPLAPQSVTVIGANNNFNGNWANGLEVYSYGVITLNNVSANWNGWGLDESYVIAAAVLDNCDWSGSACAAAPKSVILNGTNTFEGNQFGGLNIASSGAVIMNNITAENNGHYDETGDWGIADTYYGYGAFVQNNFNSLQNVTMTGTNTFNGNIHNGLEVNSKGVISLNNITAQWNGWFDDVAFGGADASPNTVFGSGVVLNNSTAPAGININMTGINTFIGNWTDGLWFDTNGSFSATKLTANNNGNDGVDGSASSSITITCGNMHGNGWDGGGYGYNLGATLITLKGVFAFGNASGNFTSVAPVITRACPLP